MALIVFDPYMGTKGLADALRRAPAGHLIVDDQYLFLQFSLLIMPTRLALLLNGRVNNLEYGSYAPGAPKVFLTDPDLPGYWNSPSSAGIWLRTAMRFRGSREAAGPVCAAPGG